MSTETLYATSIVSGSVAGDTSGAWAGAPDGAFTNQATTGGAWTADFAMGDPTNTQANGTHTVTLRVRKIASQSGTPSVSSVNLYQAGALVATISSASVSVTSGTGQDVAVTFAASLITSTVGVEFQVVTAAAGGSGSAKTPVQIDGITWSGDFTAATITGTLATTLDDSVLAATGSGGAVSLSFVSSSTGNTAGATSMVFAAPTGIANGDILICAAHWFGSSDPMTLPHWVHSPQWWCR